MTLGDYLHSATLRPFEWGKHDCATFCAGWVECLTGMDVNYMRGLYFNERTANDAMKGGLVPLWSHALNGVAERTADLEEGCIGIVSTPKGEIGAIYTGERWAMLTDHSVAFIKIPPARLRAIWRVYA